jgi:hypothetical protein
LPNRSRFCGNLVLPNLSLIPSRDTGSRPSHMRVSALFYVPRSRGPLGVALWAALARPRFIHTTLLVEGLVLWDQPYDSPGGWYEAQAHVQTRPPTDSIDLDLPRATFGRLEEAARLVEGWRTTQAGSALNVLIGWPRGPRNCATSVALLLTHLGQPVRGTTPDALWSELCRITGKTGP